MIDFLKYRFVYMAISLLVIGAGIYSMVTWGFRYSIDFTGGTNLEYRTEKPVTKRQIEALAKSSQVELVEIAIDKTDVKLRTKALDEKKENQFFDAMKKTVSPKVTVLRSETVGPMLGKETIGKTIIASLLAVLGILIYMTFAFKGVNYALAAVLAMVHDLLVVVGSYSLLSHFFSAELDLMFVTAILTTMSFSVHDTIVIFDKIREYISEEGKGDVTRFANKALTETMVRSLNNSMTIIFMLLSLTLLGGATIRFFIITLLIGILTGTYSSPFVATPILVFLEKRRMKK